MLLCPPDSSTSIHNNPFSKTLLQLKATYSIHMAVVFLKAIMMFLVHFYIRVLSQHRGCISIAYSYTVK